MIKIISDKEAQEQREKAELRLQVRLIAAGAKNPFDEQIDIGVKMRIANGLVECFPKLLLFQNPIEASDLHNIDSVTDYLYSKGVRAIKAE